MGFQVGAHTFELLTPDVVMDALVNTGLYDDGRLPAICLMSTLRRIIAIS